MRREHVRRGPLPPGCGLDVHRHRVAAHAAAEERPEGITLKRIDDLPELVPDPITLDEEVRRHVRVLDDPPVASEHRAPTPPRLVDEPTDPKSWCREEVRTRRDEASVRGRPRILSATKEGGGSCGIDAL